jgi:hypothetical protein
VDFETGLEKAGELASSTNEGDRNEATTRLQLIDRLLFDCLGWERDEAELEDARGGEYADYVLSSGQTRRLLVEAKREGKYFELPPDFARVAKLNAVFAASSDLAAAVEQALGYAFLRGLPFAAVSNGHQLIAFLASRDDGVAPLEGRALCFSSLADFAENFRLAWDNLSKAGCVTKRLASTLGEQKALPPPPKLSSAIRDYPGSAPKSDLATQLHVLGDFFLFDLVRSKEVEDDFLRECYLPSGALSQYALVAREVLKSRYPDALQDELQVTLADVQKKSGLSKELIEDLMVASTAKRPMLLVGDVGVGKTMFFRHLIRIDARELTDKAIVLYLDLGREPALSKLRPFLARQLTEQLLAEHDVDILDGAFVKGVYNLELEQFRKSVWGAYASEGGEEFYRRKEAEHLEQLIASEEAHLRRSVEHLVKARRQLVVIVFDNVDQRDADFQEQTFLIAEAFADTWPATVFVALRPNTFHWSRQAGTLQAYQPRAFTVSPPRIDRVVIKRLEYAQKLMADEGRLPTFPVGVTLRTETLDEYLSILVRSFRRNERLMGMLDNLSGGNVRRALELIATFVRSGHTKPELALKRAKEHGGFEIPDHVFLRALLLGDAAHYDAATSLLPNLLDISAPDGREHFLLPAILAWLEQEAKGSRSDGFIDSERVFAFAQDLGFGPDQVLFALNRACGSALVNSLPSGSSSPERYRTSQFGAFAHRQLLADFTYLDAIIIDTPIVDDGLRARLEVVWAIRRRVEQAKEFLVYLDGECPGDFAQKSNFDWLALSERAKRHIAGIEKRL